MAKSQGAQSTKLLRKRKMETHGNMKKRRSPESVSHYFRRPLYRLIIKVLRTKKATGTQNEI